MRAAGFEPGPFLALAPTPPKTLAVSEAEVELRLMGVTLVDFGIRFRLMCYFDGRLSRNDVNHACPKLEDHSLVRMSSPGSFS